MSDSTRINELRKEIEVLCNNCDRPNKEDIGNIILSAMVFGFGEGLKAPSANIPSVEDCKFCRCHEKEDVLYELVNWECGLAFDEIRNIKYCPLCGAMLKGADDEL